MGFDIDVDKVLVELGYEVTYETLELEESQMKTLEVGLVDLAYLVAVHDLDEQIERLLFGHVQEQRGDEERETLTIADLFVVDWVGLAELVESLLAGLVLEVGVAWECAIDVAQDDVLARRVFGQQQSECFDHALLIFIAAGQQLPHFAS